SRRGTVERWAPLVYGIVPTLIVAFALPSALRPPPDTASAGSQYSPDAPPDAKADTIVKTVQQQGSLTAGQALLPTPSASAAPSAVATPSALPSAAPTSAAPTHRASRAGCFPGPDGAPPRQV